MEEFIIQKCILIDGQNGRVLWKINTKSSLAKIDFNFQKADCSA
jgi:hypothetical protein